MTSCPVYRLKLLKTHTAPATTHGIIINLVSPDLFIAFKCLGNKTNLNAGESMIISTLAVEWDLLSRWPFVVKEICSLSLVMVGSEYCFYNHLQLNRYFSFFFPSQFCVEIFSLQKHMRRNKCNN